MAFEGAVRRAGAEDAAAVAGLLHDFNIEFDTPSPGPAVLAERLRRLLDPAAANPGGRTTAHLAEDTGGAPLGLALVTWHPNVWYDGPVALVDELYVVPARRGGGVGGALLAAVVDEAERVGAGAIELGADEPDVDALRFYRRHGFVGGFEPGERSFFLQREL
ncbi:GNAT family N-acetyltransferase [Herbiconiux sp. VKM Ac-2851]|uniref:GNAT family N-acetyltransferase n=1 Tax=Herbiconiux sp. VKM Ac-2851 TaxID=2739025 RepID=UPI00156615F4|nr:GNAT family N-acetyltransferase [Herbiconiux sp. VKM Ac-2851]NQX33637.1 GNAT family N-acetyltransferase [Herbiconiux sp. VKM Ac-2851]